MSVREGDTLTSPTGAKTRVYDLATCTETGRTIVIQGDKGDTMTTPAVNIDRSYTVVREGGRRC